MLTSRSIANSNAEPAPQADDAMPLSTATNSISLSRCEQLELLEHRAQQELLELRALRDQAQSPGRVEDSDWLTSCVDWDLSVP